MVSVYNSLRVAHGVLEGFIEEARRPLCPWLNTPKPLDLGIYRILESLNAEEPNKT